MSYAEEVINEGKNIKTVIKNRWHLHAPIALVLGFGLYWLLKDTLDDKYKAVEFAWRIFCPSFLGGLLVWRFELWQRRGRIIDNPELRASNKDLIVSEIFLILGVVISYFVFTY